MHIYATSHTGQLEGACCSSAPHLLPTRHPLTCLLEKEGSLFVMDSICLFPIPTVGNMETNPSLISLFTVPPFPRPLLCSTHHKLSIVWYHISLNASLRVRHSRCRFFFLLPSDMLFFRRKSNRSVTLCTTSVTQPPIVTPGTVFLRHIFMHSCVDLDTLRKISPVSLMEGCFGN